MKHPLVYEINTRCWLRELSGRGNRVTLGNVPEAELEQWQRLGFTHIWLMGVWFTGPLSRACSRSLPGLREQCREQMPGFSVADLTGSPFAIGAYEVPRALGGESGLKKFRQRLAERGLKLMLDFVPNHTGLDHPWLQERPELFVQGARGTRETFREETAAGPRWDAHGKDPFFPAWLDTAQLDYRNPATRAAMIEQLRVLMGVCDGLRCDMAMLVLKDVFARSWQHLPSGFPAPETEFWADAIRAVREINPEFLMFAEAYWDTEARLQELGFDYTYDKRLYDYLISRNYPDVRRHLFSVPPRYLQGGAHFLENHDEARVASLLPLAEHRAASLVALVCPGLRLLHEGQLTGALRRVIVHAGRRPQEPLDPAIAAWYERLLSTLRQTCVGQGESQIVQTTPAWEGNPTWQTFVVVQWQGRGAEFDLAVVNLASHRSQCYAKLTSPGLATQNWRLIDLLGTEVYERRGEVVQHQGLYLDVPGHAAQLFHFEPLA